MGAGVERVRPWVAVSMAREEPAGREQPARDWIRASYLDALYQAGAVPVPVPNLADATLLEACDGLLLTGGGDFDPAWFGAADAGTDWKGVSSARDRTELALMEAADRLGLPVFGICRGVQALAVGHGGRLIQDIPTALPESGVQHDQAAPRSQATHGVALDPSSRLAAILGRSSLQVNSFHHQAVETVPEGWVVSGRAPDGVVEAIELAGPRFVLGVQWHPESLSGDDAARRLFEAFVEACRDYRQARRTA
ncbi:Peptidase C26 [Candidatus Hydrogenisulfobacillus filiaventi]|uniref:Peptidase C26 n=1 Tax=Candidatus Hydrogenisulfobacillus filiaventi TaxID=2707344 RepID=A0A6F8ZH71_9FIRM|nr:gamma-glutamyl-gamma-aminobutyrate hydrolase family protein [Bacillota bacterium]CAB1129290.1 Peptidase C26 [Candidatus Hydrogenisulfobacillus filiaventi]